MLRLPVPSFAYLETWNNTFTTPRVAITDVGQAKSGLFGSPHEAFADGDLYDANPGDEFVLGRSDAYAVTIKQDGSTPRLGGSMIFRSVAGSPGHIEDYGYVFIGISDWDESQAGSEIITMAGDWIMEVWAYDQSSVKTSVGSNGRLDIRIWESISAGEPFDSAAIGDFDPETAGLEVALLRSGDGLVEVWGQDATGSWPASSTYRLAIWGITTPSLHDNGSSPYFDHMFAGDLDASRPGDELATIASDGYLEIYNPLTGVRISGPSDTYATSGHDPFLCVTADGYVPPVPVMGTVVLIQ